LRLDGKVELAGLVEHAVFEQAVEHGAQTSGAAFLEKPALEGTAWQGKPVPGQPGRRNHGHDFNA
jgi:hypothetical protein